MTGVGGDQLRANPGPTYSGRKRKKLAHRTCLTDIPIIYIKKLLVLPCVIKIFSYHIIRKYLEIIA